jgi:hypothetical protein
LERSGCRRKLDEVNTVLDFKTIRSWDGSQDRAFEELSYQLRDPTPPGAVLIKTGDPDAGLEWYCRFANGVEWGWQAKYTFDVGTLLKLAERSLRTVVAKRPQCRRLTFCIPFDLPDSPAGGERKSARQKYEDRKASWRERIPGAERVRIELCSAGELLERLNRDPAQRGKAWFFWHREVFSPDWCRRRLKITVDAAGERYTPELHVDLPIAFALEGLALSETFWKRYRLRRGAVVKAAARVRASRHTGLGVTAELRSLEQRFREWRAQVVERVSPPDRLPRQLFLNLTSAAESAASAAYPHDPPETRARPTEQQSYKRERRGFLRHDLLQLGQALEEFTSFLESGAAKAAERAALLLTGDAGQGKTHLLCDAGERIIAADRPVAVLLGGRFSGRRVWSDIAEHLGLGQVGSETLVQGMRAAAEASNAPFVLCIDALNEAADPQAWQGELPAFLAEAAQDPWIAVAVSLRSSFRTVVLPHDGLRDGVAEVEHPGFRGRELEASERFFDVFGLEQPRIPLLTPEFSNPLFLKLYCEGLKGLGLSAAPAGEAHLSEVFDRYLRWKSQRIVSHLRLDPDERVVERAIEVFSDALASANRESLPRDRAKAVIDQLAPALHEWPDTLFAQLLNEGLLTADVGWDRSTANYVEIVRFSYQRFADHRIVAALLEPHGAREDLATALAPGQPLRARILQAPAGWIEALSVQVPERLGVELFDAARWRLDIYQRDIWDRAFVQSIVSRRPTAITARVPELLVRAQRRSRRRRSEVLEALLSVAPSPEHPLNASRLHRRLMTLSMPMRDAVWSIPTYFEFGGEGALGRLIRWASRGPYPDCPDDVLELAAVPLIWTFTSPNRRMRDYVTKALTRLLAERLAVTEALIERFRGVDDPYVMERLAVVGHGAVLIGGSTAPVHALGVARKLRDVALASEQIPNFLTRDAVRGTFEWCLRQGLIGETEYESVTPPYGSAPPGKPRTKKQLEREYDRYKRDRRTGQYIGSPYGSIFSSVFDLGDFGTYVIQPKVSRFSRYLLSAPFPKRREAKPSKKKLAELHATLSPEQRALMATDDVFALVETLSRRQLELWQAATEPVRRARTARTTGYSPELAQRWVFERVISLGWDPDGFASFDRTYGRDASRSSHKPERFGKKYQWIALRELIARLADNHHMTEPYGDEQRAYEGPWQFFGRDIDPTLPPAPLRRNESEEFVLGPSFPVDRSNSWWAPPGPHYVRDDPPPGPGWATDVSDIPTFESLVRKTDSTGTQWVVLQAYYNWDEDIREDEELTSRRRRDMWSHIYTWLVEPAERDALVSYLERRTLMNRWMPEAREITDAAYLAEMPWAAATTEYPDEWQQLWPRGEGEPIDLAVYPTWIYYLWEGNVWDCSIDNGVHAMLPAPLLFDAGGLRWKPGTREWYGPTGMLIAQYHETQRDRHSALLVRESWLKRVLKQNGWSLVVGWLGEKQLFEAGWHGGLVGKWSEINGVGLLADSKWIFGNRRIELRTPAR